ncbi:hypothetical protein MPSEU_000862600 [Mayamaea pseudoterrestris]|nr:hypothetical protein MPSEU_000862600 [Mayamaea pseudoterrestris]
MTMTASTSSSSTSTMDSEEDDKQHQQCLNEDLTHVQAIVSIMMHQEATEYRRSDFLSQQNSLSHFLDAAGSWRLRIVEWMYGVIDHCSLKRDCVAHAAYYLDLCTERGLVTSRQDYQLAAMCALLISIKMVDSTIVKLQSMVTLGRGVFSEQDVIIMERKMLAALNWRVHPPTPVCFLRQFLRLLPPNVSPMTRFVIAEVTRFIAEISICLYKFVNFPPSVIAYAGMLIAMERIDVNALTMWQRHEIFASMFRYAGLDHSSLQVLEAIHHLRLSIEKNVSLNELIDSIDAQCCRNHSGKLLTYNGVDSCMNSPRDVAAMQQH